MSKHFLAQIVSNTEVAKNFYVMTLNPNYTKMPMPEPGQFYMLQTATGTEPLLKRPFSIFDFTTETISFLYRIRGKGTTNLSKLAKGDYINALGPLGKPYPVPSSDFIAVAGGIGIASLYPLLKLHKNQALLFYGAKTKDELILLDILYATVKELFISTDDGSVGFKGTSVQYFKNFMQNNPSLPIYACGPKSMLKEICLLAKRFALKSYVSLEEHMACGIGACLGCVCKGIEDFKPTYLRVCLDGPVFDTEVLVWD